MGWGEEAEPAPLTRTELYELRRRAREVSPSTGLVQRLEKRRAADELAAVAESVLERPTTGRTEQLASAVAAYRDVSW